MQLGRFALMSAVLVASALPATAATRTKRPPTSQKIAGKKAVKPKLLGQRSIEDERAAQIQAALIKAGYLTGQPSGHWDSATEAAMTRLQADNGWQTKLVPDSRAIIKLGLGPSSDSSQTGQSAAVTSSASSAFAR